MAAENQKAPRFTLPDKDGTMHSLADWKDDYIVIYFYPKDDTPGCTIEALEFTGALPQFKRLGARVVGISGGDEKTKTKFCKKHDLKVLLLSDSDFSVSKKYESYGMKTFMGRKFNGIFRTTFVIGKQRTVLKRYDAVSAKGHAKEVLAFLEALSSTAPKAAKTRTRPKTTATRTAKSNKQKK